MTTAFCISGSKTLCTTGYRSQFELYMTQGLLSLYL